MLFSEESPKFRVCGEEPGAVSYLSFKASRVFAEYHVEEADIARCPRSAEERQQLIETGQADPNEFELRQWRRQMPRGGRKR